MDADYIDLKGILALELPHLTRRLPTLRKMAKDMGWPYRKRQGRGGGVEYEIDRLPETIRTAVRTQQAQSLLAQAVPAPLPDAAKQPKPALRRKMRQLGLPTDGYTGYAQGLTDKQRNCAHARMAIVAEVLKLHHATGITIKEAAAQMVSQIEQGTLSEALMRCVPVANARANAQRGIGMRSLMGWVAEYRKADSPDARLAALAPLPTKQEVPVLQIGWLPDFMAFHSRPSAPRLAHSYGQFARWWLQNRPADGLPSIDQVRRVWRKMPAIMQERGRKTGAAYKNLLPFVRRDWDALRPNDVWIGDGHSFKARVRHPIHGRPFKPEVTVIIDGCSRMVVGFSFSLAESCVAVADALRIGIKHNGLPLIYYSDNGSGQTGKTIDHEITGLSARLGIRHETGLPGNPQGRGIIERWWKDNLIQLARNYETFTGGGMDGSTKNLIHRKMESAFNAEDKGRELTAEQRRYKAKLPGWETFMADVVQCIDDYNTRPHGELPKKADGSHYTPQEYRDLRMAQENLTTELPTPQELETMFRPQEIRKVARGEIELFTNRYFSVDLAGYHGDTVRVAYDYDDASAVYVYDTDGRFICKAKLDGNKRAAMPLTVRDRLAAQRREGKIKRAQNTIRLAEAETRPSIEQQPDYGLLVGNGDIAYAPLPEKKPLFLFESDREAWERGHGGQ